MTDEKTFQFQDSLPNLPLPSLHHTLNVYVESVKPHVTEDKLHEVKRLVEEFGNGVGKILQEKLIEKSLHSRNWLKEIWERYAYLEGRQPLTPYLNFSGPGSQIRSFWLPDETKMLSRAGLATYFVLEWWKMLKREEVPVWKQKNGAPLCMNQWKHAFNCCRVPCRGQDKLVRLFKTDAEGESPTHIAVLSKGRIFEFDAVHPWSGRILSPPELERQLTVIREGTQHSAPGPGVAALTCADRDTWADCRDRLIALHPANALNLHKIESALMVISLSDEAPLDESELMFQGLGGHATERWADKSSSFIFFKNGTTTTCNDHSPYEAMVSVDMYAYQFSQLQKQPVWKGSRHIISDLEPPKELGFYLDAPLITAIGNTRREHAERVAKLEGEVLNIDGLGRASFSPHGVYPDTAVQMALQLAYYRTHARPASTYETASVRKFYLGRTETLRVCTQESVAWCKAMDSPSLGNIQRRELFHRAVKKHDDSMAKCSDNQGCDRHLLGLLATANELGLPTPELYKHPSFNLSGGGGNFVLSTSFIGGTPVYGGVVPMCDDGYGSFYRIGKTEMTIYICRWRTSKVTNLGKYKSNILAAFDDLLALLKITSSAKTKNKL